MYFYQGFMKKFFQTHFRFTSVLLLITVLLISIATSSADSVDQQSGSFKVAENTPSEIQHFDSLFKISASLLYTNPDSARQIAFEAFGLVAKKGSTREIRSLNLLGATYYMQSDYSKALDFYFKALKLAVIKDDTTRMGDLYNNMGLVNYKTGNYKDALDDFLKAVKVYLTINDVRNHASTLNNIGLMYSDINNFDMAFSYFIQAYQGFQKKNDTIGIAAAYSNLGTLYVKKNIPDSSFYYFDKAIDLESRTQNKFGLSSTLEESAHAFVHVSNYKKALENYEQSALLAKSINYPYQQATANLGLSKLFLITGPVENAMKYALDAMQIANQIANNKLKYEAHEVLSNIYEKTGDYHKALENFRISTNIKDGVISQTKLHQIYNLEIQQLSQATEIQQLEIQRQELLLSKKNTIIVIIILSFLLIIAGVYLYYHNYKHRQQASLQNTILSLTEKKSRAAVEAEIQERKRIGQELHDGLGQMLSVARLNISVLQQKSSLTEERKKELLDAAMYSVDKAFYELRDISHNLAPSVLTEKGFIGALKDLSDQINQSKVMKVNLETFGLNGSLDNLIENTLYRAVQELINNTIKHAKATNIYLQLVKSETEITLMDEDNGVGFNMNNTLIENGGGLSNIRSRVENLSGSIFIDAMADRGTIITIVIPLKNV